MDGASLDMRRRPSVRRVLAWTAAVLAISTASSCGFNMTCVRHESVVTAPGRPEVPVYVWIRPFYGLVTPAGSMSGDAGLIILIGVEVFDLLASTGVAIVSIFDDDLRLAGGPAGWLLAIVPPFTAVPEAGIAVPARLRATPAEVDAILGDDPRARDAAVASALQRTDPESGYGFVGAELR